MKRMRRLNVICNTSSIQANRQHNITASRVLSRTVSVKGIGMALIEKPWFCEGRIRGPKIPGHPLFSTRGIDRSKSCILKRIKTTWMLPGLSCRDLVAILIKYNEDGAERWLDVCCAYLPYYSKDPPTSKEFKELARYCESKNIFLVIGCDFNAHYIVWDSTNGNDRGEALVEFLNSSNLDILNQGRKPTFCRGGRLEMIEISLWFFGFLESIPSW